MLLILGNGLPERQSHLAQRDQHDEQDDDAQVEAYSTQLERWDQSPQQPDRRIGHRGHDLDADCGGTGRPPGPGELPGPVQNDPRQDQHDVEVDHVADDAPQQRHRRSLPESGCSVRSSIRIQRPGTLHRARPPNSVDQDWLKKPLSILALSEAVTVTLCGLSRKTFAVTRSIRPCRPKVSPAAKSTRRFASASSMSERFMITGVFLRKLSPIVRASL